MSKNLAVLFMVFASMVTGLHAMNSNAIVLQYARDGDAGGLDSAMGLGGDINVRDGDGKTPLIIAAGYNDWIHLDTLRTILKYHPNVNLTDNEGNTAYYYAKGVGNEKAMEDLVKAGADPHLKNEPKKTGIYSGALNMLKNLRETHKTVPKAEGGTPTGGALPEISKPSPLPQSQSTPGPVVTPAPAVQNTKTAQNSNTENPDSSVIEIVTQDNEDAPSLFDVVKSGNPAGVQQSLSNIQTLVNKRDANDWSALMYAAHGGNLEIVKMLVEHDADILAHEGAGWNPLLLASSAGHAGVVEYLIKKGAYVDCVTSQGTTPLIAAAGGGSAAVVEALLKAGARMEFKDQKGRTAMSYALEKNQTDVIQVLRNHGANEK